MLIFKSPSGLEMFNYIPIKLLGKHRPANTLILRYQSRKHLPRLKTRLCLQYTRFPSILRNLRNHLIKVEELKSWRIKVNTSKFNQNNAYNKKVQIVILNINSLSDKKEGSTWINVRFQIDLDITRISQKGTNKLQNSTNVF